MAEHRIPREHATAGSSARHDPVLRVRAGAGDRITVETDDEAYAQVEATRDLAAVTATINPVTDLTDVRARSTVQASITAAYEDLFAHLVDERGWDPGDACVAMSATAHTELGGPTGSGVPDPLHPLTPVGAVTLARMAHDVIEALATR